MKNVLITGSTRGIGFGLAKQFLAKGCKVTINGRSQAGVEKALTELKTFFPNAMLQGFVADVCEYRQGEELWTKARTNFGDIDIWINNAGVGQENKYLWELIPERIRDTLSINVLGLINASSIAFKGMLQQGHGQIFNMEGFGSNGMMREKLTLYGTSKSAVTYFSRSLAKEANKTPVKVGTISPGMVVTELLLSPVKNDEEFEQAKKIFNILADEVDTVTEFLVEKILKNDKNDCRINWLTKGKMIGRFALAPFNKRNVVDKYLD